MYSVHRTCSLFSLFSLQNHSLSLSVMWTLEKGLIKLILQAKAVEIGQTWANYTTINVLCKGLLILQAKAVEIGQTWANCTTINVLCKGLLILQAKAVEIGQTWANCTTINVLCRQLF